MTTTYTTDGPVRGCCGHAHRSIRTALACRAADSRACKLHSGPLAYSDRQVVALENGTRRPLTIAEWDLIDDIRAGLR